MTSISGTPYLSDTAIDLAKGMANERSVAVNFIRGSFFGFKSNTKYDLIYDAGLFHHIFPHRRPEYQEQIISLLNKNGTLGIVAFNEKMGTQVDDWEIYEQRSMEGGISYPQEKLELIFNSVLKLIDYRSMKNCSPESGLFGHDFVSTSFWKLK